ncbi:sigma factor-binding protein Crl [Vibrio sp. TH_r3]|uniref:sigma factor-binding protein Crl n=1 Tax=Vibrio sp. TH_r3 TaxID=3082084 RepID=UPI0029549E23|nr:sigma factor-binding protein Crl [Vibrio sp. TH_r3]MDV7104996.1 sigma factor-binding protein Crl [Vibrio sp. TH_r3]
MVNKVVSPTHFRLLTALRAIGPYLRESESTENSYLFDCLSVCVDDKQSPEMREFWGWWMELDTSKVDDAVDGFIAKFKMGMYDTDGNWQTVELPESAIPEVTRTQQEFLKKLHKVLEERFDLSFILHEQSVEFI